MALIDFNSETNSLKILKGIINKSDYPIESSIGSNDFSVFKINDEFKGIRINEYLSELELKGIKAEKLFKDLLEKNNIPFLYIGQGAAGIERSSVLKEKMKSKRPDFLVNLPDIGCLFFDVKCRRKIGFPNSGSASYFHLFKHDIEALIKLQQNLLVPVWIAFVDQSIISDENNFPEFYLVPISLLKKFNDSLKENIPEEYDKIECIRIPDALLYLIKNKFSFNVGMSVINEDDVKLFAKSYKGLIRKIEDLIKGCIRSKSVLKTNLVKTINPETKNYAFRPEVEKIFNLLIDKKIIEYEAQKPLALQGE